ncbi:MAG: SDR family oxidoreductase [Candidatus Obscuribacterales bacterium]|nr:SDR family oxidoreductase [Candidatus Obscuribacterales bacterium]
MVIGSALVSGASRGIGEAISRRLAESKWRVGLLARSEEDLARVADDINQSGGESFAFPVDVTNAVELERQFAALKEQLGAIDLLVCNAGSGKFAHALDMSLQDWDEQMNLNARASFVLTRLVAQEMVQRRKGQIVFITSDAAKRTFASGSVYCASKYAQYAFASALRQELRPQGVRVTVLLPGLVASYFNNSEPDSEEKASWLKPSDVADAVAYAVSVPSSVIVDEITLHPVSQDW